MKIFKTSLVIITCFVCSVIHAQQISIDNSLSEQQLVQDNLVIGCVEVSNISSSINGSVNGFGSFAYFERANSNFPFQNGIMLSTGNATSGGNTLNTDVLNEGDTNWGTDADLETALGTTGTLNATSIEFDFISISNQVQFNYILASEEYFGNFPCQYSDGFAFLIRETGTNNPYTNIALIPGTTTPVNTTTIHDEIVGFCNAQNDQFFEGYNLGDTNYNGRTTVLTATASITPNVQYHIKMVIADQTDQNYDSAVFIEGNSFNASVDLGEDITTCADSVFLDGNIANPQATYSWFFNGNLIPLETQPTLSAIQTGNYRVVIEIPINNSICTIEDDINITLSSTQSAGPISDYELCDDVSNDGFEIFDLSTKTNEVLSTVPTANYNVTYHFLNSQAVNNTNAVVAPFQNVASPQTIFVRVEDIDSGCLAFTSFNIVVNPLPTITTPTDLDICDDQTADGFTTIDLSQKDDEITNGQTNLVVTYYLTQSDADSGSNAIPLPYVNTNQTEQLFVRVVNSQTGCSNTTTLTVNILDNPVINTDDHYIDACDPEHDGFANFNLNTIIAEVLEGITGVSVTFYETQEDALTGANPIIDPTNYANTTFEEQILYIRVVDNNTGCASVTPIEIHANLLLTGTNIRDFSLCDIDNDGTEDFDLNNVALTIINDIPDITITFYETETDRDNQTNPIDTSQPYTPSYPQTLYISLNSLTCTDVAEIELTLNPVFEFTTIGTVEVCDEDQDGFTSIDLSQFDASVSDNQTGFTVSYFESQSDANANINPLPPFYTNISNPQNIYTRIQFDETGCSGKNEFVINVLLAPESSQPTDILICDDDQDAMSIVNLNDKISELVTSTTDRVITFHQSLNDADSNLNAITTPSSYSTSSQTIFARIENTLTGCHSTESFNIIINTLPVFTVIDNYKICENGSDGFADFIFNTKDAEILNGQTDKQTLYFETQTDADNRTNEIDKTVIYQNTSNPQTIFVRVENNSDQDCYGTASFTIEVGTNPVFNEPLDWFVCDNIDNDGSESFDLSTKIDEISQGINDNLDITFYTTLADAENTTNQIPLQFVNTVNPQQIYVNIDNGTICTSITSFTLNVIQSPDVNESEPLITCDTDYDGVVEFDLTIATLDILDVRQDNITVGYFETLDDVESNSNEILNPDTYNNISNPQTVYIKVTNTISNCFITVSLDLIVNLPPTINTFNVFEICDNDTDNFNLTEINSIIVDDNTDVVFSYYANNNDAQNETNPLDLNYTYLTNSDTIFARVAFGTTQCFVVYPFTLQINPLPVANQPISLETCDDDFDGFFIFDLLQQNATVLGNQNANDFTITYYDNITSAEESINDLGDLYAAIDGETIYVRIENNTTGCFSLTQFTTIVHPRPIVDIPDQVICLENFPLLVSANTNVIDDVYLWSTNETTPEIEITEVGTYSVIVTTAFGCETTVVFDVTESEQATIELTETVDFSDPNNITITISGIGNYLYVLDNGVPQESNIFENVSLGLHTITVIDLNGCSEISKEVVVIDVPKFVTPNNDGYFDTWHITGVETLPGTIVYIFDRYGKLLKTLGSTSIGWDGTYNGSNMPSNDYWFVADVKKDDIEFQVKGHFALKR